MRMSVSGYLRCLRPDSGEILWAGGPLDQRNWKISKLWLPWQPLLWQPKNPLRAHKMIKRVRNSSMKGIWLEENCCHGFMLPWQPICCYGNQKMYPCRSIVEKCVLWRCHFGVIGDLGDVSWNCDVTLAPNDAMVQNVTSENQET